MKGFRCGVVLVGLLVPAAAGAAVASKTSAASAIAAAQAEMKLAASMQDQWIATVAAMKDARLALKQGDFAAAETAAVHAKALASLSVEQAKAQRTLWVNEAVH